MSGLSANTVTDPGETGTILDSSPQIPRRVRERAAVGQSYVRPLA